MRKLIAITHLSLDGVMQSPGGPQEDPAGGFTHGGWIRPFGDEALHGALMELISSDFDLLLGRRTYEIFAAYWPHADDSVIKRAFNKATKYVVTNSLDRFDWVNTQAIGGPERGGESGAARGGGKRDAAADVRRLKETDGPDLHIWGSGELLATLVAADLVDEFRLWVYPLILGKGKRLFREGVPRCLTLTESQRTPRGILLNTYRLAGPLPGRPPPSLDPSEAELTRRRKLAAEARG